MEMGRQTKKFPFGDSPFQNRVCSHLGINMDTLALLPKEDKKFIQDVMGTFLYFARCFDSTMLAALGSIATQQANPTKNTVKKVGQFLVYSSNHPDAIVTYHASDMVLAGRTQRCIIPLQVKGTQPGGQTLFHVQQHCQTTK
jgi:hypothetical protein